MNNGEIGNIALEAGELLKEFRESGSRPLPLTADNLLLFGYRLRDGYRIVRSTSTRFKGSSFAFLQELLYQLESRPDETMSSVEWREMIERLLIDLALGKIVVTKK